MILDNLLKFCEDADISQVAGTYLAANQVPVTNLRDIAAGTPVYLVIAVKTAIVGVGASVEFRLRSDNTASIHDTTSSAHGTTGPIPVAQLTIGALFSFPLPNEGIPYEEFLGVQAIVSGATTTAGTYDAYLTIDPPVHRSYPNAVN